MRDRVFTDSSSTASGHRHWYTVSGGWAYNTDENYTAQQEFHAMRDTVIPNYTARSKKGELFFNYLYSVLRRKQEVASQTYATFVSSYFGGGHEAFYRLMSVHASLPTLYESEDLEDVSVFLQAQIDEDSYDAAVTEAWANIQVSEAQALASLGELPETIHWLISLMKRIIAIVRFFKSKKARTRALKGLTKTQLADALADMWLEFRYAIRPLVFDVHSCLTAMKSEIEKGARQTARGYEEDLSYVPHTGQITGTHLTIDYQYTEMTSMKYRAGVLFDIESDINGILALWGFDQPLEAIWDLTPFSFIIDWIFNIGDLIGSWSVNASLRPLGSWITVDYERTIVGHFTGITVNTHTMINEVTSFTSGGITDSVHLKMRIPHPGHSVVPTFNLKLDTSKLIDLATIGRGLYRSLC